MSSEVRTETEGADRSDLWITVAVKIGLFRASGLSGLHVSTDRGSVTLYGKVPTVALRSRAETVVRGVRGVKDLWSLLQVVPETRRTEVDATDARVATNVGAAQKGNDRAGIKVVSVDDGVVLLGGRVQGERQKSLALESARRCSGVRDVISLIVVEAA